MFLRRKWVKTTGRVLDSRIRKMAHTKKAGAIPLHNYIVEFQAPSGQTTRLEVEQEIWAARASIGDEVPLLVKPDATKAVFDKKDPRVNVIAVVEADRQVDEERFRRQLDR